MTWLISTPETSTFLAVGDPPVRGEHLPGVKAYVRGSGAVHPDELFYALRAGRGVGGRGVVVGVVRGDELARSLQVPRVHDALDKAPVDGLVLFR